MTSLLDVFVVVKPDTDKFGPEVKRKLARIDATSDGRKVGTRFGVGLNGAIGSAVSKSAALFTAGFAAIKLGGLITDSVSLEAKFSQTMNTMAAVANVPKDQMKSLSDLALKMGADTTFSASEAGTAMLELAKGGMSAATISAGGLKGTLQLAAAGGTDLATASTIASNAMNTFGLKGSDMAAVAAALAGGANASSASVESLGEALSQVGPGARTAGLTLQDTVGVLSAFDAAGVKGSDAGTSLKTMLTSLVPSSNKARNAMKDLGLKFTDAKGAFLPITAVAQQLKDKLGKLSAEQKTTALTTIFGSDASRAATVLMNEGAAGIGKYITATKDQGAAEKVAAARMAGTAGAWESFKGSVETAKLQLGLFVAPAVQGGLKFLTGAVNNIAPAAKKFAGEFKTNALPVLKDFGSFVTDKAAPAVLEIAGNLKDTFAPAIKDVFGFVKDEVLPRLKDFGDFLGDKVVPKVGELAEKLSKNKDFLVPFAGTLLAIVAGLKAWAFVQAALNLVLAANPIGLIVVAIAALVGGLIWAYKNSDTFKKIVDTAFKVVRASAVWMWDNYLKPMFEMFVKILKGVWETAQNFAKVVSAAWNAIKEPARIAIKYVVDTFLGFVDSVLTGASKAFGWVPGLGPKLKTAATEFGKFRDSVNKKLDGINDQSINVELKYSSKGVNLTAPSSVGRGMADGGGVFGGVRGKDSVPALLMPEEHVWTTKEVKAAGGHGAMKRLRQAALAGELNGFANGGSPSLSVNPKLPSAQGLANEVASHKALLVKPYLARLAKALDGGVGGPPGAVQNFRGVKLNTRTIRMLGNAERMLGALFHITQGSYSTRVAASGSTHAGGGAMDTNGPHGWGAAVKALRAAGFAAWHRSPSQGPWGHHIHSIALGDSSASQAAKNQMASYRRGGDGLGHGVGYKPSASLGYNTAKMKFGAGGGVTKKMARDMGMQIFDNGGKWKSGTIAANTSGKTETVTAGGDTMTVRLSDEDRRLLRDVRAKVYLDSRELGEGMSRRAMREGY